MRKDYKSIDTHSTYLVTGAAGFIGFHLSKYLLSLGCNVVGYDNINDYYDVNLKYSRLEILNNYTNFSFIKGDLVDKALLENIFADYSPDYVINLAAQAGVRYSIENPEAYINSNVIGFFNILEVCRSHKVKHLIYASSSSVYGHNKKTPYSVSDKTDSPVSLYAATKKSNELMAYCYSNLYGIKATGLRFFTVYGPYGRPDMAYFSFTNKIIQDKPIQVFNDGHMFRDFTYIDDIIEGIVNVIPNTPVEDENKVCHKVYNIGNHRSEELSHFVDVLQNVIGKRAQIEYKPMQPGDVLKTYAEVDDLIRDFDFHPNTSIEDGLKRFWEWYKGYYKVN